MEQERLERLSPDEELDRHVQLMRLGQKYILKCYFALFFYLWLWPLMLVVPATMLGSFVLLGLYGVLLVYEYRVMSRHDSIPHQTTFIVLVGIFILLYFFAQSFVYTYSVGIERHVDLQSWTSVTVKDYGKWLLIISVILYSDCQRAEMKWARRHEVEKSAAELDPTVARD